ncbi:DUF305 domain-containing protein [Burkholderia cenocepacia]|nr:DUF305 domain-containing protein [Burkholderia cenocepacia]
MAGMLAGMAGAIVSLRHVTAGGTAAVLAGGTVDVGFSQAMIAHHDQAVSLARIAVATTSPQEKNIAEAIIGNQLLQMGQMRGWLETWGQREFPKDYEMTWMSQNGKGDRFLWASFRAMCGRDVGMPGLASVAEMTAFRKASGKQADVLFLKLMIRHHQGGLPMLRYAALNAESYLVRSFAYAEQFEEVQEIAWMEQQLALLGAKPLPFRFAERLSDIP